MSNNDTLVDFLKEQNCQEKKEKVEFFHINTYRNVPQSPLASIDRNDKNYPKLISNMKK